ncbi:MAG TPA: hypothetical protein VKU89_07835 [Solirubrobacteraceae bacterium]|nr:hypothetical protein [Solirubrobacteraceae bacterium]
MRAPLRTAPPLAAALAVAALGLPGDALAAHSVGTPEQISWVRSAAQRFVAAELSRDSAAACAILNPPLRTTVDGRSCAERWQKRLAAMLRSPRMRAALQADARAIAHAVVIVHGNQARIELPHPLLGHSDRFNWTENCWMLER